MVLARSIVATGLLTTAAYAAFDANSNSNVVTYWGAGYNQDRLIETCKNPNVDIINLAFVNVFPQQDGAGSWPGTNFGNACNGSTFSFPDGTPSLLQSGCNYLNGYWGNDIKDCQTIYNKKIFLSLGGDSPVNIISDQSAANFADFLWNAFGNGTEKDSTPRPFGDAIVDGFDFDIESPAMDSTAYTVMANTLKAHYNENKKVNECDYYLSAAPQCFRWGDNSGDKNIGQAITHAWFDFLFIQFYNNPCGVTHTKDQSTGTIEYNVAGVNMDLWVRASTSVLDSSVNPNVKLFFGIPGGPNLQNGDDTYYIGDLTTVHEIVEIMQEKYTDFGGVMIWEAQVAKQNLVACNENYLTWMKRALTWSDSDYRNGVKSCSNPTRSAQPASSAPAYTRYTPTQSSTSTIIISTSSAKPTSSAAASSSSSSAVASSSSSAVASSSSSAVASSSSSAAVYSSSSVVASSSSVAPVTSSSAAVYSSSALASSSSAAPVYSSSALASSSSAAPVYSSSALASSSSAAPVYSSSALASSSSAAPVYSSSAIVASSSSAVLYSSASSSVEGSSSSAVPTYPAGSSSVASSSSSELWTTMAPPTTRPYASSSVKSASGSASTSCTDSATASGNEKHYTGSVYPIGSSSSEFWTTLAPPTTKPFPTSSAAGSSATLSSGEIYITHVTTEYTTYCPFETTESGSVRTVMTHSTVTTTYSTAVPYQTSSAAQSGSSSAYRSAPSSSAPVFYSTAPVSSKPVATTSTPAQSTPSEVFVTEVTTEYTTYCPVTATETHGSVTVTNTYMTYSTVTAIHTKSAPMPYSSGPSGPASNSVPAQSTSAISSSVYTYPVQSTLVPVYSSSAPVYTSSVPVYSSSVWVPASSSAPVWSSSVPAYSSSAPVYSSSAPVYSSSAPVWTSSALAYPSGSASATTVVISTHYVVPVQSTPALYPTGSSNGTAVSPSGTASPSGWTSPSQVPYTGAASTMTMNFAGLIIAGFAAIMLL
ncbi:carbohydrate-binding module family 18 protein, protein [Acrodontium crateriforme]|uniref:chitinase n=1 Tax=Acrodontium crateriforme TaxID=150365 RepID=A0AAQ3M587_9PEZI|nr:carbohydrate-binding module family 18 protein, protein [Acrodontium crateriforme]